MHFEIFFTQQANEDLAKLEQDNGKQKQLKAVRKTLGYMETDLRHPGLNTHEFTSLSKRFGVKVYEAYAENNTAGAYRVFWCYGPDKGNIIIIAITSHP